VIVFMDIQHLPASSKRLLDRSQLESCSFSTTWLQGTTKIITKSTMAFLLDAGDGGEVPDFSSAHDVDWLRQQTV
jgi:hypothetical protein